jgi:hypothetical protein
MLLTIFVIILAAIWLAAFLTAFCPLRAWRRRKELAEDAEETGDTPEGNEKTF